MARLNDIPDELLTPEKLVAFTSWLSRQPMHITDKRELTRIWSRAVGRKLNDAQWAQIK